MHIGIDATALYGRYNGVEYALWNGLRALAELETRHFFTVWIPADGPSAAELADFGPRWRWHRLHFAGTNKLRRIAWQQLELPALLRNDACDVLHAPTYVSPLHCPVPVVLTVYDLIALDSPELATAANRAHYCAVMPAALRRAARIIVPTPAVAEAAARYADHSHATRHSERNELASGVEESPRSEHPDTASHCADKVRVIPLSVDPTFQPANQESIKSVRARHNLPPQYLLFVGNREPKKNLPRLLEALAHLVAQGPILPLVIAGEARAWGDDLQIPDGVEVIRLGYVPREDLPALMSGCTVFLFPSLAEGFGLPVLEALACGAPVVASLAVPIPGFETAATQCDPLKVGSIAAAISLLLGDDTLRAGMTERGPQFAAAFSSRRSAELTLVVLEEAAKARHA